MFTKKKIIGLILVLTIFISMDLWIINNIKSSFEKIMIDNIKKTSSIIVESAPSEDGKISTWIKNMNTKYPEAEFIYISGSPVLGVMQPYFSDKDFEAFYNKNINNAEFKKGIDSASYSETYFAKDKYSIKGLERTVIFVPVVLPDYDDVAGIAIFTYNTKNYDDFFRFIDFLGLLAVIIFAVIYIFGKFSRDPVLGYTLLILFIIVGVFIVYPLYEAVRLTFIKDGLFSLDTWKTVLTEKRYLEALWGSIILGICTATVSTLIGFLFAFVLGRTNIKHKKFISTMATLPVISPPFSLTLSIILLFGKNGFITNQLFGWKDFNIYGLGGLTFVQTMCMFPIAFLTMAGVLESIDSTFEDAALNLRASKWKVFSTVTLPLATPGILSAWLLVFTNSLADFANPLILAGDFKVLSVEAYLEVTGMNRLGNGAALSLLLLLPTLTAFFTQRFIVNRKSYVTVTGKPSGRITELVSTPLKNTLVTIIYLMIIFLVALYGTIIAGCFVKNWGIDYTFTLDNFKEALSRGASTIGATSTLAAIATPIAGILAMVVAVIIVRRNFIGKKLFEALVMTPFAIPGTLIGISYIIAFNKPPLILVGTAVIIVINYVIRELPVGVEGGIASLKQIDPSIEEAAQDLGADVTTVFRTIVLPLVRPAFISSLSYTFVRSMTAVSAVIFLISAKWNHMTVLIYNFSENLRFGLASVLATTLIVIVLVVFGLMRLLVRKNENLEKSISGQ